MMNAVLLVEDFDNDVVLVQRSWRLEGIKNQLQVVTDGRQAVDYLSGAGEFSDRNRYPLPCLVLLDFKLPRLMGLEVLRWIRCKPGLDTMPVLVLSNWALQNDVDQAYRLGANAFLVKPSDIEQLSELLRLIRDFWLVANHPPGLRLETNSLGAHPVFFKAKA